MIILKILGLFFGLLIVPFLIGSIPVSYLKTEYKRLSIVMMTGYIAMFAILEIVGIPVVLMFTYDAYTIFKVILLIAFLIASLIGVLRLKKDETLFKKLRRSFKSFAEGFKAYSIEAKIYQILIALAIVVQLFMLYKLASMDADDFYFNAHALSAQIYKTMYRVDPNTGLNSALDIRHCLALIPMWQAFVSSMTGIHVAILVHKILPIIFILLSYSLVNEIGLVLFEGSNGSDAKRLLFVFLINIWRIFGFNSYYTTETFFLLRTWQGKSIAGNLILPGIIWVFLVIYKKREGIGRINKPWLFILLIMEAGIGACSSIAVLISCMLVGLISVIFVLANRNLKQMFMQWLCMLPAIAHVIIYVVLLIGERYP